MSENRRVGSEITRLDVTCHDCRYDVSGSVGQSQERNGAHCFRQPQGFIDVGNSAGDILLHRGGRECEYEVNQEHRYWEENIQISLKHAVAQSEKVVSVKLPLLLAA